MKTLSVNQPYASLIAAGIKNIENRSWYPRYRGDILIASTKKPALTHTIKHAREICDDIGATFPGALPASTALCVVRFRAVVQSVPDDQEGFLSDDETLDQIDLTWLNDDLYGWVFEDVRLIIPFRITGRLGLYEIDDSLIHFIT